MRAFKDIFSDTADRPVKLRMCAHPSCALTGDYRAPKSRDRLNDYYYFCLDHVRAYNKEWDYFAGLSPDEVETYNRKATVWERPSWPMGQWGAREQALRHQAMNDIFGYAPNEDAPPPIPPMPLAEREALAALDLCAPVTFADIKARYRILVKQHHPDLHGGAREAEEKFKNINAAFATLRGIYEPAED
ncbi:MAG: DnaJ domain-containing protein [Alphaproteobacteria bacterium]|nr:DnaJ domain-containing protein [Alphaproteobacteria bacterium]